MTESTRPGSVSAVLEQEHHDDPVNSPPNEAWKSRQAAAADVLRDIPESPLILRRRIEAELGFLVRPETVQATCRMAEIEDEEVVRSVRRLFSWHVVAVETIRSFWSARRLQDAIRPPGLNGMEWLLETLELLDVELFQLRERVERDYRDSARQFRSVLLPSPEPLRAAAVMIPEFEWIVRAAAEPRFEDRFPTLSGPEIEILRIAATAETDSPALPERVIVDGIALRDLIESHLAREEQGVADEASRSSLGGFERGSARRTLRIAPLVANRIAYSHLSARLQKRYAAQLADGDRDGSELNSRTQKRLFESYRRLSQLLTDVAFGSKTEETDEAEAYDPHAGLRERIEDAEQVAEGVRAEKAAQEDLLEEAVGRASTGETAARPDDLRSGNGHGELRRRILTAIAGGLLVVAVATNLAIYRGTEHEPPDPSVALNAVMPMDEILPVGEMIFSEIPALLWSSMSDAERRANVDQVGRIAAQHGFTTAYLFDEERREVARWTADDGVELLTPEQP